MANEVLANGWTAVPIDPSKLFDGNAYRNVPAPLKVAEIAWPSDDPLVSKMQTYAKEHLSQEVYNHSMRVYYFGTDLKLGSLAQRLTCTCSNYNSQATIPRVRYLPFSLNTRTYLPFP